MVIVGTPIHKASQVVVHPPLGMGSRAMSTWVYWFMFNRLWSSPTNPPAQDRALGQAAATRKTPSIRVAVSQLQNKTGPYIYQELSPKLNAISELVVGLKLPKANRTRRRFGIRDLGFGAVLGRLPENSRATERDPVAHSMIERK